MVVGNGWGKLKKAKVHVSEGSTWKAKHRSPFLPFPCLLRSCHCQISQDASRYDRQNTLKYKPSGTSPFYPARYVSLLNNSNNPPIKSSEIIKSIIQSVPRAIVRAQQRKQLATATIKKSLKKGKKYLEMYFWKKNFITTDVIIANELSRSHHVHHRKTLQKENPVKQNIVSLSQKKHFSCKRLVPS